ncbi:dihydrofolate reductase-like domain-containing protein [Cokeromyces recurvatus]|uniref:dihydrofolate reductase-like domain-containing protein n=1 Tax=Cokeromyces recurvatus TaxID=90255 RepID=UPI00221E96A7|nr:dihydrofolate reductase-like domain-containing protein [Cokeromyces recurvatus]KAI7901303.1 dihydrofolate reductase-like domain-containing protein [Cokeromyces recurvatus]
MTQFALVVAATEELGIGLRSNLPWRIPKDMAFFKSVTSHVPRTLQNSNVQNVVIMGRVTWESIPAKFRPLDNRFNIIVSRNLNYDLQLTDSTAKANTLLVNSLEKAFEAVDPSKHARVFVIGGAQIYKLAIQHANCSHIVLTRVKSKVDCDTFFPTIQDTDFRLASHQEFEDYVEQQVPEGVQKYKELEYEFTLYIKKEKK